MGHALRIERLTGARDDIAQQRRKCARGGVLVGSGFASHLAGSWIIEHYDSFRRTGLPFGRFDCYIRGSRKARVPQDFRGVEQPGSSSGS